MTAYDTFTALFLLVGLALILGPALGHAYVRFGRKLLSRECHSLDQAQHGSSTLTPLQRAQLNEIDGEGL